LNSAIFIVIENGTLLQCNFTTTFTVPGKISKHFYSP
jgi:hypothetical protein